MAEEAGSELEAVGCEHLNKDLIGGLIGRGQRFRGIGLIGWRS